MKKWSHVEMTSKYLRMGWIMWKRWRNTKNQPKYDFYKLTFKLYQPKSCGTNQNTSKPAETWAEPTKKRSELTKTLLIQLKHGLYQPKNGRTGRNDTTLPNTRLSPQPNTNTDYLNPDSAILIHDKGQLNTESQTSNTRLSTSPG